MIEHRLPVNLISLVGHGTVRIGLNGKGNELLSTDQLKEMDEVIEKTLDQGAAGVSFGLMYEPGQFAPYSELERIAKIVKKKNKIVTFHARACSKVSTSYQPPVGGRAHNLRAMDEVLKITFSTQVRTEYSHLIFVGKSSWNTVDESLQLLEDAKKTGHDVGFDMYPMEFGASVITVVLPTWYLGMKAKKRKRFFTKIRLALEVFIAKKALGFGFHDILIANTYGQFPEIEGKRISEIAKERKKSQLKTYLEIIEKTNARVNVLMFNYQNPEIIEKLRHHPQALYMTDAWIEPEASVQNGASFVAFAKFLTLAKTKDGAFEETIHKMTQKAAERFRIPDRGLLQTGKFADINVIDPVKLNYTEGRNESPSGWKAIFINGQQVLSEGEPNLDKISNCGRFIPIP
jgi:N-acyl-D-amino-acid deacylase